MTFYMPVSVVSGTLFNLNTHCRKMFSCSDEKDVYLMSQQCSPVKSSKQCNG